MSLFDLTGRIAIVTGGNGGIGLGMAEGLAAAGATVRARGPQRRQGRRGREAESRARAARRNSPTST
jgi:NAD(P)-dependent dehydrogenase (short-subunit alcohol dehydrogenase family)